MTAAMKPLHPSIRTVWTIRYALWTLFLVLTAATYDGVVLFRGRDPLLFHGFTSLLVLAAGIAATVFVPRLRYRYWQYEVREEDLYVERGILNRVYTVVPLRRIQHLDVSQNILEREFDLGKLIVHTAGSRSSDVVVPGLGFNEAERLRDELKHFVVEDELRNV